MHRSLSDYGLRGAGSLMSLSIELPEIEPEISEGIELPSRPLHTSEPQEKFRDSVVGRLTAAKAGTEELRQIRGILIGQAIEGEVSLAAVDDFLETCEINGRLAIEQKHSEIRARGREQTATVAQLEIEFGEALAAWDERRTDRDKAQFDLRVAKTSQDNLPQFASNAQIRAAATRVKKSRENFRTASEDFGSSTGILNACGQRLEEAKATLKRISTEEAQMRSTVLGESFYDADLGLESMPIAAVNETESHIQGVVK